MEEGHADPVDIRRQDRYSAMHFAAEAGSIGCIRILLKYGAPDRPRNVDGTTPYDLAHENKKADVVKFLSEYTYWSHDILLHWLIESE